jgi:predicted DNA-binding ribbon-helix-helix protein
MKSVQLSDDLYKRAAELAEADHVSIDRLVAALVDEGVGSWARIKARSERGALEKLKHVLSKVSDEPGEVHDRL